jgi:hypothetical protein
MKNLFNVLCLWLLLTNCKKEVSPCGDNVISISTALGSFCDSGAERGSVIIENDDSYSFDNWYNNSTTFRIIIYATIKGKGIVKFVPNNYTTINEKNNCNIYSTKNDKIIPFEGTVIPKLVTLDITKFSKDKISGTFEIEIDNENTIKGVFSDLKTVKR